MINIPFNKPFAVEKEFEYIKNAIFNINHIAGDGYYTKLCHKYLESTMLTKKALLTHSCTGALEMSAILLNLKQGDEIIMPSYTFVSTANAFVLRGCIPVFIDIRPDTLNINENMIEKAITKNTKAIVVVHYAGVACEMDKIMEIAKKNNLYVIEDSAQAIFSEYKGKKLGTIGDFGALSFHETKNIISGEGGAILINNSDFIDRAEIIREKGTNRSKFFRGEVDKYTWCDIGSSFLPSDIIAAFLYSQLENIDRILSKKAYIWNFYNNIFQKYEQERIIKIPKIPKNCKSNFHIFYLLFNNLENRTRFLNYLKLRGINPVFHYVPLHNSSAGKKYCKVGRFMEITNNISDTLVRMPSYFGMSDEELYYIAKITDDFFKEIKFN